MQRLSYAAVVLFSLAAIACSPAIVPASDGGGGGGDVVDGGGDVVDGGGTCEAECVENATCGETNTCECDPGYVGDGQICDDVDECVADNGGCDENALCINRPGDRRCVCNANFVGDGETCTQSWVPLATANGVRLNPDNRGAIGAAAGSSLFFGAITNTEADVYMRAFNLDAMGFSGPLAIPPGTSTDFCACGLSESFVSDGNQLYLLGNQGQQYDIASNRWASVVPYADGNRRGEAAATYDASTNSILLIGGRSNETTALRFNLPTASDDNGNIEPEPGTLPVSVDRGVAFTLPSDSRSFIAQRDNNGNVAMMSHDTGSPNWIRHADAPPAMSGTLSMGQLGPDIWVVDQNETMFFYNPPTDAWSLVPLAVPVGTKIVKNVGNEIIALVDEGGNATAYRLNAIE